MIIRSHKKVHVPAPVKKPEVSQPAKKVEPVKEAQPVKVDNKVD